MAEQIKEIQLGKEIMFTVYILEVTSCPSFQ